LDGDVRYFPLLVRIIYRKLIMKRITLVISLSLAFSAFAFAGEEIQLASAIGAGSRATAPSVETGTTASGTAAAGSTAGSAAASAAAMGTASMVTIGVLAAGAIAVVAGGGSSSTSHH
jgi:hypothetical protein